MAQLKELKKERAADLRKDRALAAMNPLGDEIRAMIEAEGPIGVDRYMTLCLQHPRHGYYTTRETIGRDFITAPEVHQMFGELVGLWAAQVWLDLGSPAPLQLVELGPGRGTLMADVLRATRIVPGFHAAVQVHLVETSPRLRDAQAEKLEGSGVPVAWHATLDDVSVGAAIVLANEFFDALPVRQYLRGVGGWHERLVGLDAAGALAFGASIERVTIASPAGRPGDILEVAHVALAVMTMLAGRIAREGGALLALDYGHAESSLGETLQAVCDHRYADVLAEPGEADLTAHVDFSALCRTAGAAGGQAFGPVEQGTFLGRLGIFARADALKRHGTPEQAAAVDAALARLTAQESSMATLFKAMAVVAPGAVPPPGFEEPA